MNLKIHYISQTKEMVRVKFDGATTPKLDWMTI